VDAGILLLSSDSSSQAGGTEAGSVVSEYAEFPFKRCECDGAAEP